jgi:hypothetical protein
VGRHEEAHGLVNLDDLADGLSRPGIDPRQWVSFGVVDTPTAGSDEQAVVFDASLGPLVNCTLQPSGISVPCRVAGSVAGNFEAEYYPFQAGDEVIVLVPGGDERAGCTIVGRLNNELDQWPGAVAGQDATQNTFGFRRMRCPFITEFASSYMLRSAGTGSFLTMTQDGQVVIADSSKNTMSLTSDFVGMMTGDSTLVMQLNLNTNQVVLQASSPPTPTTAVPDPIPGAFTTLTIDPTSSSILAQGTFSINTVGNQAIEHATSAEAVANMIYNVMVAMWEPMIAVLSAAVVGAPGSPVFAVPLTPFINPAGLITAMLSGLSQCSTFDITPFAPAIAEALVAKANADGTMPSVGSPGFLIG